MHKNICNMQEVHGGSTPTASLCSLGRFPWFCPRRRRCQFSQPAFSRSIQTLERDLDCVLVERGSRDFRLTGQGQLVLQHARRLLAGSQNLHNELLQYNGLEGGELNFGSGPYPAQLLVPEALAQFIHDHPLVRARFHLGDWEQLGNWLKEQQIEFLVADSRYFKDDPRYQVQVLRPRRGRFSAAPGTRWPTALRSSSAPCSTIRLPARESRP